jgi:RNA polymerase sigma-70 factor (ECF subfamily)
MCYTESLMVPADPSEEWLVQRAQRHDPEAVSELYRRYAGQIYRFCLFRVSDEATAQDLAEDVFLNMLESLPRYVDKGRPFVAWLYRIAHDRVVDHYRRRARRPSEELTESLLDHTPGPEVVAALNADIQQLREAMPLLNEDYRLVLQMRFVEGYDVSQTARNMGKSVGATKVLQHRALKQLARLMKS